MLEDQEEGLRLLNVAAADDGGGMPKLERLEIPCTNIGKVVVHIQGMRASNKVVIMTMQDLGCTYGMYQEFVDHPCMRPIRDKSVWIHVSAPGQGQDQPDLPLDYQYPTMSEIGSDLVCVLDHLKIDQIVCFAEGAGANILARFAMAHITRVIGVCLIHATGTTAGLVETLKEKMMKWDLKDAAMNPTAENYLMLHRFGTLSKQTEKEQVSGIEAFQAALRSKSNARNLKKFVEVFLRRTNITDEIKNLKCPVLLVTGQLSMFNASTRSLHQAIVRSCDDKSKVDFIEVVGVANVLEEKPDKLAECFQFFLQGLGLVSSIPMPNVLSAMPANASRNRRMSMEEYDKPTRERKMSSGFYGIQTSSDQRSVLSGALGVDRRRANSGAPGVLKFSQRAMLPAAADSDGTEPTVAVVINEQPFAE